MVTINSHSSDVMLSLMVAGHEANLSHVGPHDVILREECAAMPPGNAEIRVTVDGTLNARTVFLPNGIQAGEPRVEYE